MEDDYRFRRGPNHQGSWSDAEMKALQDRRNVLEEFPPDREGLIAVLHPWFDETEEHRERLYAVIKSIAMATGRHVFYVMTESRWRLVLFGIDYGQPEDEDEEPRGLWYDQTENGHDANDQFISHYDPDGTYHLDGAS